MAYIKTVDGMRLYAPLDAEDEALVKDLNIIICDTKGERAKRTTLQNRSIHKYCALLAEQFEGSGLDMQEVLSKAVPVRWTMEAVKEVIWKRIQVAMFPDKPSTTQLETKEVMRSIRSLAVIWLLSLTLISHSLTDSVIRAYN